MLPTAALLCLVVGVIDGNTIKVRCGDRAEQRVQLADIAAPLLAQPGGRQAKQMLTDLLSGKEVQLEAQDRNRDRLEVAQVYLGPKHINAELVGAGMAWCRNANPAGGWCASVESGARSARAGVWTDKNPVAPWEWKARAAK